MGAFHDKSSVDEYTTWGLFRRARRSSSRRERKPNSNCSARCPSQVDFFLSHLSHLLPAPPPQNLASIQWCLMVLNDFDAQPGRRSLTKKRRWKEARATDAPTLPPSRPQYKKWRRWASAARPPTPPPCLFLSQPQLPCFLLVIKKHCSPSCPPYPLLPPPSPLLTILPTPFFARPCRPSWAPVPSPQFITRSPCPPPPLLILW